MRAIEIFFDNRLTWKKLALSFVQFYLLQKQEKTFIYADRAIGIIQWCTHGR